MEYIFTIILLCLAVFFLVMWLVSRPKNEENVLLTKELHGINVLIVLLLLGFASCRPNSAAPAGAGEGADVTRHWHPEDRIVHLFEDPDSEQVAGWKAACEQNELHVIDSLELSRFAEGVPHLTAFYDLNNLSFQDADEYAFVCWRLAQFTGDSIAPAPLPERLALFRQQIGRLLDFDAEFQVEHNMKAGMKSYLQHCYNRIAIRQFAQLTDSALAAMALRDFALAERYAQVYDSTFEAVNYYDGMASSYPVEWGESQTYEVMTYRSAVNAWVYPDSTCLLGTDSRYATVPRVLAEYDTFIAGLVEPEDEDDYLLPVAQRREALLKEKAAWKQWMDYRAGIAPRLPASFRPAFDHATRAICRRKLIALKNRYQCFGYQSQEFVDELLPFDCGDEQLAAYNYEQVFKDLF